MSAFIFELMIRKRQFRFFFALQVVVILSSMSGGLVQTGVAALAPVLSPEFFAVLRGGGVQELRKALDQGAPMDAATRPATLRSCWRQFMATKPASVYWSNVAQM